MHLRPSCKDQFHGGLATTLNEVASARTRIKRTFDPEAVRQLKVGSRPAGIAMALKRLFPVACGERTLAAQVR